METFHLFSVVFLLLSVSARQHGISQRKASLIFQGNVCVTSDPLPEDTSEQELVQYFNRPQTRKIFVDKNPKKVQEVPVTSEWEALWKKCSNQWYGGSEFYPQRGDCILQCDTYSKFPGLTVCTTVYTGVKTIHKRGQKYPQYTMNLIGQTQRATGLTPMVWMFHQLMGIQDNGEKHDNQDFMNRLEPSGPVKTIISVVENEKDRSKVIKLDSNIQITVEFPAGLLRILPTSKKRAEKQGSAAIIKTIAKHSKRGVEAAQLSFLEFRQQQLEEKSQRQQRDRHRSRS